MDKYLEYLLRLNPSSWVKESIPTDDIFHDDDIYDSPPDDWYMEEEDKKEFAMRVDVGDAMNSG